MPKFSEQLIARTQTYFFQKHGLVLSVEETTQYLHSLADLYEVMAGAATARLKAAGPPDLIDPHSC